MKSDGRSFLPSSDVKTEKVVEPGQFCFAVAGLVHGHVFGMISGLLDCGATLVSFFDENEDVARDFMSRYPEVKRVSSLDDICNDSDIRLVVNCIRPDVRAELSVSLLKSGKAVFSDKPGFITIDQFYAIDTAINETRGHYCIYFSERFHAEGPMLAQRFIDEGRIGKVNHYIGTGPHRLNAPTRPWWFFESRINGSIIIDLGCHLVEQFLSNTSNRNASVVYASMSNRSNSEHPDFFDTGDIVLRGDNGVEGYIHVDWYTPDGLSSWGDGRTVITGDKGYIEVRKYIDITRDARPNHVYLVDGEGEQYFNASNTMGFPFFGKFVLDCLNGTFDAIGPKECINAMRISVEADAIARKSLE
ncbi:MAG: Gfo/Idh/MocA family oxidoreductase [Spirochaetales bacterium]|nr:Gfo/Idh/MocA family oxidoreductase [Spirochaetales bacterium]